MQLAIGKDAVVLCSGTVVLCSGTVILCGGTVVYHSIETTVQR